MLISPLRASTVVAYDIGLGAAGKGLFFLSAVTGVHNGYAFAMRERKKISEEKQFEGFF